MPVSRQKVVKKPKDEIVEKNQICIKCGKRGDFYASKSIMHTRYKQLPWCKNCIIELFEEYYKRFQDNEKTIIQICKLINIPFFKDSFELAKTRLETAGVDIVAGYFFAASKASWNESNTFLDSDIFDYSSKGILLLRDKALPSEQPSKKTDFIDNTNLANEVLFGNGYLPEEYIWMRNKYEFIIKDYSEVTNMHTEAIVKWIKLAMREEFAIVAKDSAQAKSWGDAASKAATNAKINPSQFSKADLAGGSNSFSEIFQAVEQASDVISILPQFKYRPNDAIDMLLWNQFDYSRHLAGLPFCSYEEIYGFYDEKKYQYIKATGDPSGIYKNDTTENNREAIKGFIFESNEKEKEEINGEEDAES